MVKEFVFGAGDFNIFSFKAFFEVPIFAGDEFWIKAFNFEKEFFLEEAGSFKERLVLVAVTFEGDGFSPKAVADGLLGDDGGFNIFSDKRSEFFEEFWSNFHICIEEEKIGAFGFFGAEVFLGGAFGTFRIQGVGSRE